MPTVNLPPEDLAGARTLRAAIAQINPIVGDIAGNVEAILESISQARHFNPDLMIFPEMVVTGYPIDDLALRPAFADASKAAVATLAEKIDQEGSGETLVILGYLDRSTAPENALAVIHRGRVIARYVKRHLPNYGVFDEFRHFQSGSDSLILRFAGVDISFAICEDIWREDGLVADLRQARPGLVVVINGSPFERAKEDLRRKLVEKRTAQIAAPIIYCNMTGGQDDLVFDGASFVMGSDGEILARAPAFEESVFAVDIPVLLATGRANLSNGEGEFGSRPLPLHSTKIAAAIAPLLSEEEEIWAALKMGLGDYVGKNGFASVALGISGGIDSALVATLACDALGPSRVHGVCLPSKFSSDHSLSDAKELARNLGMKDRVIDIEPIVASFRAATKLTGIAEENIQARVRGSLLMGISNQEGHLILATGNKSELAVGYSTLYGDAVGGFAPIKDLFKVDVWDLARWRNRVALEQGEVPPIPVNSIEKEPSAELREGQRDRDSLPEYQVLDQILKLYIDGGGDARLIISAGFEKSLVERIIAMVDRAEYKRRQYPPGTKVSPIAFGKDRRLPMTSHWKES